MHRSLHTLLLGAAAAVFGCTSAASVCGCHPSNCGDTLTCPPPDTQTDTCVADPAAGRSEDRCGIFASSSLGSDDNPGTRELPVRSVEKAITLAQAGPLRVYACAETFEEAVALPSGVALWGGLDCANDWIYLGGDKRTVLAPSPDAIPLRVAARAGGGTSVVADVRAEAADATIPSGSSIAVMVMPGAAVEILRSELVTGDGAPGADGEDGGDGPATAGTAGSPGVAACSHDIAPGAPEVQTTCGTVISGGGRGGDGLANSGGDGATGQPEPIPNPMEWGDGGRGATPLTQCTSGADGQDGGDGAHGLGATGPGRITIEGWEGQAGQDGGDGLPGQGGGGGGGSRGGLLCGMGSGPKGGASGGSGGAGGCGGRGGKGGGYGGASIGLLTLSGDVAVRDTLIVTRTGGDGGAGGFAQAGGLGGPGGPGGGAFSMANPGCQGGPGGQGGDGGYGGGGLGGPSIGVAYVMGQQPTLERTTIQTGAEGVGGPGGLPPIPGSAGTDGFSAEITAFPLGGAKETGAGL